MITRCDHVLWSPWSHLYFHWGEHGPSGITEPGPSIKRPKLKGRETEEKKTKVSHLPCQRGAPQMPPDYDPLNTKWKNSCVESWSLCPDIKARKSIPQWPGLTQGYRWHHQIDNSQLGGPSHLWICDMVPIDASAKSTATEMWCREEGNIWGRRKSSNRCWRAYRLRKRNKQLIKAVPPQVKVLSKRGPLQILIEKAEMSEGSSDEFPRQCVLLLHVFLLWILLLLKSSNKEKSKQILSKNMSAKRKMTKREMKMNTSQHLRFTRPMQWAKPTEKFYIMFCDHLNNIIGGCEERQANLHANMLENSQSLESRKEGWHFPINLGRWQA